MKKNKRAKRPRGKERQLPPVELPPVEPNGAPRLREAREVAERDLAPTAVFDSRKQPSALAIVRANEVRSLSAIIAEIDMNSAAGRQTSDAVIVAALRAIDRQLMAISRKEGG